MGHNIAIYFINVSTVCLFEVAAIFFFISVSHHQIGALPDKWQRHSHRRKRSSRLSADHKRLCQKELNLKECRVVERKSIYAVDPIKGE